MNLSEATQKLRQEVGVSRHIPVTHLNSPTVAETRDGKIFSIIKIDGVPFQTEQNSTINSWNGLWQRLVSSLDENICLMVTVHRQKVNQVLQGDFPHKTLNMINDSYMKKFESRSLYQNTIYMTIIYRGLNSGKLGKGIQLWNKLSDNIAKEARDQRRRQQMRELEKIVDRLQNVLSTFKPTVLGTADEDKGYSELLSFLSILVNGGESLNLANQGVASVIANSLEKVLSKAEKYPQGNLAEYLPLKRIFFGEAIQFQGLTSENEKFAGILSIKSYPEESASVALNTLMHLDGEWISTHTFAIEAKDVVMKKVKLQTNKLKNVNDAGTSQINSLSFLQEQVQTGGVNTGYHHHTLMLLSDNQSELDQLIHQAARCYLEVGFPVVRETLGQEAAFWAQFPGNLNYIARSCLITSENFADFCPLHNYHIGYRDCNHLGSAVTLLETSSKTPYFFNFHKAGSKTEITPGHTTIIGSNGAGKTVLMTFLDAQISRYHGRSVFFDRDRGTEIYVRSTGGVYSVLSPDHPESSSFNPLHLHDTPANRQFCQEWLAQLCKKEGEATVEAEILEPIKACIDYAFEKLSTEHRYLSNAIKVIAIDFPRWPQLRRWLKAEGKREAGQYAYLFDNPQDSLRSANKIGFDMTHFLDHEPAQVRTALLMYLFYWIKSKLDGNLMTIWLDEAWQYFTDPYWETMLKKTLPTFRKLNAFLVMATQSAASVAQSSLCNMILDNSATQIFFPNPDARVEYYQEGFSLTDAEFLFIKENDAKSRQFLVKQGHGSVIVRLDLSHMRNLVALLSADKKSIQELDDLRKKYGDAPEVWLSRFLKIRENI